MGPDDDSTILPDPVGRTVNPIPPQGVLHNRDRGGLRPVERLRSHLGQGSLGSLAVKVTSTVLALLVAVLLARTLGPAGYGVYAYVFALISLLTIPAQVGMPTLVVRETAKAHVRKQWGLLRGLWLWSSAVAAGMAFLLALSALAGAYFFRGQFTQSETTTFFLGLLLVPLIALGNLRGAALRGLQRVIMGQLPEMVLRPGLLALLLLSALLLVPAGRLTAPTAMGLHALAAAMAFLAGAILLWRARPRALSGRSGTVFEARAWFSSALPLALVSGMMLINQHTDILMLGLFRSAKEVGIFRVAVSSAALVTFGLQAINMVVSPRFASLYAHGNHDGLQELVTQSARVILLLSLPVAFILVFLGGHFLVWVFGAEYQSASLPLGILATGQLVNAGMGSVGALLNMTGHERDTARGVAIAAAVNVALNLLLIPPLGMSGAALATASSTVIWNLVLWRAVRRRIGIQSLAFNFRVAPKPQ